MTKFKETILLIIAILLVSIISPNKVKASLEFKTKSFISYQVGSRGDAEVEQEVTLINNFSNIYPKEYHLKVERPEAKNISADDDQGKILKKVSNNADSTEIQLKFNQQVVGKDKELNFKIRYSLPSFAIKRGQVWEITIPGINNIDEIEKLKIVIKTPKSFGELAYSSQPVNKTSFEGNWQLVEFQKEQLNQKSVILAFGEFQIFNFTLNFFLRNSEDQRKVFKIPIPPDTAYQSTFLKTIEPPPEKVTLDTDFNWLANYPLDPNEIKNIAVKGQVKIFPQPENLSFIEAGKNGDFSQYLSEDVHWQVNHPVIKDLSSDLKTAKQIQRFVVEHLEYDLENISSSERVGGLEAYQLGKGVCTEFSDLFITLSRAIGIPARELEGFAFTENQKLISLATSNDILHSWVEYWDTRKDVWVPTDPTWSETTDGIDFAEGFDLGHFTFVIHGASSTEPPPPGFYKTGKNQKNVYVEFADKLLPQPEINVKPELVQESDYPEIKVKNHSLKAIYQTRIKVGGSVKAWRQETLVPIIPPLGEKRVKIRKPNIFQMIFTKPVVKITLNDKQFLIDYPKQELNFASFFANLLGQ